MKKPWIPYGGLKDGTLLFGPLRERPTDMGPILDVTVNGSKYYVVYCCKELSEAQKAEVHEWAESTLSGKTA